MTYPPMWLAFVIYARQWFETLSERGASETNANQVHCPFMRLG